MRNRAQRDIDRLTHAHKVRLMTWGAIHSRWYLRHLERKLARAMKKPYRAKILQP